MQRATAASETEDGPGRCLQWLTRSKGIHKPFLSHYPPEALGGVGAVFPVVQMMKVRNLVAEPLPQSPPVGKLRK